MKLLGSLICKLRRKHKEAVFEFQGCKPDLSSPEGCVKGIPVYKVSCPRCGVSFLKGEEELAKELIKALAKQGKYKEVKVIQYTSGYQPRN